MNDEIIQEPKIGEIWTIKTEGNVWVFRYSPYQASMKSSRLTGFAKCVCIDSERRYNIGIKIYSAGFLGYDDEIEFLRPANKNELAIYNRIFRR